MNKLVGELVALYRRTAGPSLSPPFLLAHYDCYLTCCFSI